MIDARGRTQKFAAVFAKIMHDNEISCAWNADWSTRRSRDLFSQSNFQPGCPIRNAVQIFAPGPFNAFQAAWFA